MYDLLGHLFYITILCGTRLVVKRNKIGWLLRVVGDIGWVAIGWHIQMYSIVIWSSIFALNDLWGYIKWRLNEDSKLQSERQKPAKVCSGEDKRNIPVTGGGCSIQTDGLPGTGHHAKCPGIKSTSPKRRVQKHKTISKPKRIGTSKVQRKTGASLSSRLEATAKELRELRNLHEPRRLSKTDKGEK